MGGASGLRDWPSGAARSRRRRRSSSFGVGLPAEANKAVPKSLPFPLSLPTLLWVVLLVS